MTHLCDTSVPHLDMPHQVSDAASATSEAVAKAVADVCAGGSASAAAQATSTATARGMCVDGVAVGVLCTAVCVRCVTMML